MNSQKKESIYFVYFDSLNNLPDLISFLNSHSRFNISNFIYILIPSFQLYHSIYTLLNQYPFISFFVLENILDLNKIEQINKELNYYSFFTISSFLYLSKNKFENLIECKLPCLFHKKLNINDLINNNHTLYTISKSKIDLKLYQNKLTSISKKLLDMKLENMDFDFLHIRIYSSYFLNLFFQENKFNSTNIFQQNSKLLQLYLSPSFHNDISFENTNKEYNNILIPNFYIFYIFFLVINNQLSIYNLSSNLHLPEYFYLFNNDCLNKIFNFLPFFKSFFIIF